MDHFLSSCSLFHKWTSNSFVLKFYPLNTVLLGSSALSFFLGGHWVSLYILIDKKISLPKRIFKAVGVSLVLFLPSSFTPNTSYLSHYVGLFGGFFCFLHYLYKRDKFKKYEKWVKNIEESDEIDPFLDESYLYEKNDGKPNKKYFYH